MKIDIENRYIAEEEISHDSTIFVGLCDVIEKLNFPRDSVFDAGCRNGKFLSEFFKRNPQSVIAGCDYFQWAIDACDKDIKPFVYRFDMRDRFEDDSKYDLVICTEVAEHIDPDYCSIFLQNLRQKCKGKLIITWSRHGGENDLKNDTHHQHLNPKTRDEYFLIMKENGFSLDVESSIMLLATAHENGKIPWYMLESIAVFS